MRHGFYVYYRIEAAKETIARAAVDNLFLQLFESEGIAGRLMRRADDEQTWMEIYEGITQPTRFKVALETSARALELTSLVIGGLRHIEHFQELDDAGITAASAGTIP